MWPQVLWQEVQVLFKEDAPQHFLLAYDDPQEWNVQDGKSSSADCALCNTPESKRITPRSSTVDSA